MDELSFVLKGFFFAILLVIGLQYQVGGETLEVKSDRWVHTSQVGLFLNKTADGATRAIHWVNLEISNLMHEFSKGKEQGHRSSYESSRSRVQTQKSASQPTSDDDP